MSAPDGWRLLRESLEACRAAGREAPLWLRDDDAVAPTPALQRLLDLCGRHAVPLALAVIPAHATETLAGRLAAQPGVTVLVHGWSHANHAPPGRKKQELGFRPRGHVLSELQAGMERVTALFGAQAAPVLVPPWNRIDPDLVGALPELGYRALSVFGPPRAGRLPSINATVDIIDWHGGRGCRDHAVLAGEIAAGLEAWLAQGASAAPVGLLTHHLVHDESAWAFLEKLFAVTAGHGARWHGIGALAPAGR